MHQSGDPLLKFSHQLQKSNAIRYTINFLHSCLGVDYVNVIKGASNVNELLLLFEQAVETSRPDSSVLLERGDTWQERDMLAEYGINPLFQPPYSTHLNTCGLSFRQMKAFFTEIKLWQKYPFHSTHFLFRDPRARVWKWKPRRDLLATPEVLQSVFLSGYVTLAATV